MECSNPDYRIYENLICGKADNPNDYERNDLFNILFEENCCCLEKISLRFSVFIM